MKDRWNKRRLLQGYLLDATGCSIQHTGWPCGTCFAALRGSLGLPPSTWHACLVLRGDYKTGDYGINMPDSALSALVDLMLQKLQETRGGEVGPEVAQNKDNA